MELQSMVTQYTRRNRRFENRAASVSPPRGLLHKDYRCFSGWPLSSMAGLPVPNNSGQSRVGGPPPEDVWILPDWSNAGTCTLFLVWHGSKWEVSFLKHFRSGAG